MAWTPEGNGYRCSDHDEWFKRGRVCSHCPIGEEQPSQLSAEVDDLPAVADYERRFLAIGEVALSFAQETVAAGEGDEGGDGPSVGARVKALDTAIKAFRAGMECARYREDWKSIPRLRSLLANVKSERAALALERRRSQSPAEVRH